MQIFLHRKLRFIYKHFFIWVSHSLNQPLIVRKNEYGCDSNPSPQQPVAPLIDHLRNRAWPRTGYCPLSSLSIIRTTTPAVSFTYIMYTTCVRYMIDEAYIVQLCVLQPMRQV